MRRGVFMRTSRGAACVAALGLVVVSAPAVAMHVRTDRTVIARGADGSKLVEVRSFGPEGGGSLAYQFEGGHRPATTEPASYVLSSDFSPGGPTHPQTVSDVECRRRVEALGEQLRERGYPDVSLNAKRCLDRRRDGLVTVRTKEPSR